MTLGAGEVIDAGQRGSLGRFINHSCAPNCETQKWQVGAEVSIGFFALRDIAAGEEVGDTWQPGLGGAGLSFFFFFFFFFFSGVG